MTRRQPLPDFSQPAPDLTVGDLRYLRRVVDRYRAALVLRARVDVASRRLHAQRQRQPHVNPHPHRTAASMAQTWTVEP